MENLDALARLNARLESLERRVHALEHSPESPPVPSTADSTQATPAGEELSFTQAGGLFPVVGKSMLGIAGAYLLRAIAESGSFPKLAVVALALAYAGMWLVWAARVPAGERFQRTVYALTAALILAPMLWELTLRFHVLPPFATAALLVAFMVAASALSWKHNLAALIWVASVTGTSTALALLIATSDLVPFVSALLVMACITEISASRNRWLTLRPLVAVASDLAVLVLLYIYSRPESARSDYRAVGMALLLALPSTLFLIYGGAVVLRTALLRQKITIFEIAQTVLAFLLAAFSVLRFGPSAGALVLGTLCLLLSAASYAVAFACFDHFQEQRNYHVYASWSAALWLAGNFLCLSPVLLALCLSGSAIVATLVGCRAGRLTLEFHGLAYLAAAAFASDLLNYAGGALAGAFPAAPRGMVWIVAGSAILCYAIGGCYRGTQWNQRLLQVLSAILAVSAAVTFLVSGLVWLAAAGMTLAPSHVAVIRTLITCAVALALSFSGSRWQRIELVWIAYGMLALVTAKLLFEDLQHGHPASTAISIFLYAVALIGVPRIARLGRREDPARTR